MCWRFWWKLEEGARSDQGPTLLTEATDALLWSHVPPEDAQHRPTVLAGWIWTFHDAETELLQEQQTPAQPWRHRPMKPSGSNHQRLNPHPGFDQLIINYSITMVIILPLFSILNWKMWILVPVLPASNMMQYWWVGAPDSGLWCLGGVQPARRSWGSHWASCFAASRWRLTNVRYVSRNPKKMKTPASFGTFITTHSGLSFPANRRKLTLISPIFISAYYTITQHSGWVFFFSKDLRNKNKYLILYLTELF